jgi:hypothetical protein
MDASRLNPAIVFARVFRRQNVVLHPLSPLFGTSRSGGRLHPVTENLLLFDWPFYNFLLEFFVLRGFALFWVVVKRIRLLEIIL